MHSPIFHRKFYGDNFERANDRYEFPRLSRPPTNSVPLLSDPIEMGQGWSAESSPSSSAAASSIHVDDEANDDISSSDSSDSSTSLTTGDSENEETTEDEETSLMTDNTDNNETTEDEYNCEASDDEEDATPKSKKVIITDFVSSDLSYRQDTCCGKFTTLRETAQKRVQQWNCSCDLFPALLKIEGSPEKNGIALAIIYCHGFMYGDHQYLTISENSTCKRCVSPIPLTKVMAALDDTQKNTMCALFSCRVQDGPERGYDSSSDTSSLATRFASLLMPCGPGSAHFKLTDTDPMRHLLLKTLGECNSMREVESLHGQLSILNVTPIEVMMTDDWMRLDETNDEGLIPPKRPRMEELSPQERLMALMSTYNNSKESHENRCRALEKLRFHVAFYWEEIVVNQSSDVKTPFLDDILKALEIETDDKLIDRLVQVIVEAAMNSIDRTTGFQTWSGIDRFVENAFNTGSVSLKMKALSILSDHRKPVLLSIDSWKRFIDPIGGAIPKSKKVIITDFVSTDCGQELDTRCGPFTDLRETSQQRVQKWNCSCDLFPALLQIEGSPEKDGIGLAIVHCFGMMIGNEKYLAISKKSTCKRCVNPIPFSKVMAALDNTQKNTMCALFSCPAKEGPESGYDSSFDPSSLATRFVSLLLPCGPDNTHTSLTDIDPMRHLLLNTLGECKSMREAESLQDKFFYASRRKSLKNMMENKTPIKVIMTADWMRNDETNDEGLTPPKRLRMEELSPQERLMALMSTYNNSKESHEKRCCALEKLRFHVAFYWKEIVANQSSDVKTPFLDDILKALTIETDDKLIDRLVQVIVEAAMNSIDRTTGFQTCSEIVRFIENSLNSDNISLKMTALSILSKVPNLFGQDNKSPLSFMKSTLEDSNTDIQSAAIEWLFHFLRINEEPSEEDDEEPSKEDDEEPSKEQDLSPLIPILVQRSEERMKEKNSHLIRSIEKLTSRFSSSLFHFFKTSSVISINNMKDVKAVAKIVVAIDRSTGSSKNYNHVIEKAAIDRLIKDALNADLSAAAEFFEKFFSIFPGNNSNQVIREWAFYFLKEIIYNNSKNQAPLAPLIPVIIKLAVNREDKCAIKALLEFTYFPTIKPYIKDTITLCMTILNCTEDSGETMITRFGKATSILNTLFSTFWSECFSILGVDGISALFKQLNQIVLSLTEQKEKIRGRKEEIVNIITMLAERDETRAEIAQFITDCSNSTNSSMKIIALRIVSRALNVIDCSEAPSFFARMLNDKDSSVRSDAAEVFCSYTEQVKNEDTFGQLSNLIPVVIKTIKGIDASERRGHCDSLLCLIEANPTIIDAEHIHTVVEFYMRIDIKNYDQWEDNTRWEKFNCDSKSRLLTALKDSNALETTKSITHAVMNNGDWKERCMGLLGLVIIAKEGREWKEEHIEQIIPLLKDPHPRVRSHACLAVEYIKNLPDSEFKERSYEMIIPSLISALKDEFPKVGAHAASALLSYIVICPKEILMPHLNPLIEESLKFAQKVMIRIRKSGDADYLYCLASMLLSAMERAEQFDAPLNSDIMVLLKICLKEGVKMNALKEMSVVRFLMSVIDCISFVGRTIAKETFIKDVDEILRLIVGCSSNVNVIIRWIPSCSSSLEGHIYKGVARWCEIIGSDFARLLPLVIDDIVQMASSDPIPADVCDYGVGPPVQFVCMPEARADADSALTTFAKILGVNFAPFVDKVFKAAQQHLKHSRFDLDCWAGEIFSLLLLCLDSNGDDKRDLWTQFWPAIQIVVKERNKNDYSAKVMKSIARSIEILGSGGITDEEITELGEFIKYELDALKKRREVKKAREFKEPSLKKWDKEYKENEIGMIEALQELCKVGETILGLSLSINDLPLAELTGDEGAEESNLPLVQESSDDEIITAIE